MCALVCVLPVVTKDQKTVNHPSLYILMQFSACCDISPSGTTGSPVGESMEHKRINQSKIFNKYIKTKTKQKKLVRGNEYTHTHHSNGVTTHHTDDYLND